MVGFIVDPSVMSRVERGKLTMFDHWPHAFFTEISTEFIPVVSDIWGVFRLGGSIDEHDRFDSVAIEPSKGEQIFLMSL